MTDADDDDEQSWCTILLGTHVKAIMYVNVLHWCHPARLTTLSFNLYLLMH
eukprot:COSAG06_NODE_197_length_20471_cov_11.067053_12_plen_51_part_00